MSTRPQLIALVLGLVLSVFSPLSANAASCSGDCNPDVDECCKDDCTWEDENETCIAFNHGETCRTKKCTYLLAHGNDNGGTEPTCTRGNFNDLPNETPCIGTNPCAQGTCNGSGQCLNQSPGTNPCEDGNTCTTNTCTGSGTQGFTCSSSNVGSGTSCTVPDPNPCKNYTCDGAGTCVASSNTEPIPCGAFPGNGTCQVKTCSGGSCSGPPTGSPIPCVPGVCESANCTLSGSTPVCVKTDKPRGTLCDTNPWDCSHQRCNSSGDCKSYRTTTLKECDADTNTAAHCTLSYCAGDQSCRTAAQYIHSFAENGGNAGGTWNVEDARTKSAGNRFFTWQFLCPQSDGNFCTSDRCDGDADSCHFYGCEEGEACPLPQCGDVCDDGVNGCTCYFNP